MVLVDLYRERKKELKCCLRIVLFINNFINYFDNNDNLDKMVRDDLVEELENLVKTDENGSYILKKSLIKLAEENKLKEKENEKEDPLKKLVNENFFKNWEEK